MIFYIDDCCIFFKDKKTIDSLLKDISKSFKMAGEGDVKSYIGMNVIKDTNGTITMIQPDIMNKILNSLWIHNESKMHDTPENVI